jgi:hypothetical protein
MKGQTDMGAGGIDRSAGGVKKGVKPPVLLTKFE